MEGWSKTPPPGLKGGLQTPKTPLGSAAETYTTYMRTHSVSQRVSDSFYTLTYASIPYAVV